MVAAIAAPLAGALGISTAAATTVTSVALYAGVTAASYYLQQANQPKPEIGTKLRSASGGAVGMSAIFGEKETAGSLIYQGSWGKSGKTPNGYYVRVYCLSDLPCNAIKPRVWASGKKLSIDTGTTAGDGSGNSMGNPVPGLQNGDGNDFAWVKFLDGSQTVADPYLRAHFAGADRPWTTSMIGRGRALAIVTERYNVKEPTGLHDWTFVVEGALLYDWRKDSTNGGSGSHRWGTYSTYEYTASPMVIGENIMRGIFWNGVHLYGGDNWPARRFDGDSWTAAANVCDENVTLAAGGTEKRYRMGAEINFGEPPLAVLDRILATCNGRMVETGGVYKVYAGGIGASVYSFTDGEVIVTEALTGKMFPTRADIANTIAGSYVEPDNGGQTKAYGKRTKAAYVAEDRGEVRAREMNFDYIRNNRQAQRCAMLALNDNRRFMTKVVAFPSVGRKLEPGDVVTWSTSVRFGFSLKKFIVGDVTLSDNGVVLCILREADATDPDWSTSDEATFTVGTYGDIVPAAQTFSATVTAVAITDDDNTTARRPAVRIVASLDADDVDCRALLYWVRKKNGDQKVIAHGRSTGFFNPASANYGDITFSDASFLPGKQVQVCYEVEPYSDRPTSPSSWVDLTLTNARLKVATTTGDVNDIDIIDTPNINTDAVTTVKIVVNTIEQHDSSSFSHSSTSGSAISSTTTLLTEDVTNPNASTVMVLLDWSMSLDATIPSGLPSGTTYQSDMWMNLYCGGKRLFRAHIAKKLGPDIALGGGDAASGIEWLFFQPASTSGADNRIKVEIERERDSGTGSTDFHVSGSSNDVSWTWWKR